MKKMHLMILGLSLICAKAGASELNRKSVNFAAPVVVNTSTAGDKDVGSIIYDSSSNQIKALNSLGGWDILSNVGGNPNVSSSSTGLERIERMKVTSTCTSSPCTIASQSGNWVTSVVRNSLADYTINFTPGSFVTDPTCTFTILIPGQVPMGAYLTSSASTSSVTFKSYYAVSNAVSAADSSFEVICMGAR